MDHEAVFRAVERAYPGEYRLLAIGDCLDGRELRTPVIAEIDAALYCREVISLGPDGVGWASEQSAESRAWPVVWKEVLAQREPNPQRSREGEHVVACSACGALQWPPRLATTTYQSCHGHTCAECAKAGKRPTCDCKDA